MADRDVLMWRLAAPWRRPGKILQAGGTASEVADAAAHALSDYVRANGVVNALTWATRTPGESPGHLDHVSAAVLARARDATSLAGPDRQRVCFTFCLLSYESDFQERAFPFLSGHSGRFDASGVTAALGRCAAVVRRLPDGA